MHKAIFGIFAVLFLVIFGVTAVKTLNPYPADPTPQNIYSKFYHTVFPSQSEYLNQAYINNLVKQVVRPSDPSDTTGVISGQTVSVPPSVLAQADTAQVLGTDVPTGDKWIDVNLTTQTLQAMEGNNVIYTMKISSGLPWTPTPTGTYYVWLKVRSQTMIGGSKAAGDYYDLPNVKSISYFYGGYGIHGAYWNHHIGIPQSHGCINLTDDDAAKIFAWDTPNIPDGVNYVKATPDNPGTRVVIHT